MKFTRYFITLNPYKFADYQSISPIGGKNPISIGLEEGLRLLMAISQDSVVVSGYLQIGFCGVESACLRIAHVPSSSLNLKNWGGRRVSNPQPQAPQARTLPLSYAHQEQAIIPKKGTEELFRSYFSINDKKYKRTQ